MVDISPESMNSRHFNADGNEIEGNNVPFWRKWASFFQQEEEKKSFSFWEKIRAGLSGIGALFERSPQTKTSVVDVQQESVTENAPVSSDKTADFALLVEKYNHEKPMMGWGNKIARRFGFGMSYRDKNQNLAARLTGDALPQLDQGAQFNAKEKYTALMVAEGKMSLEDAQRVLNFAPVAEKPEAVEIIPESIEIPTHESLPIIETVSSLQDTPVTQASEMPEIEIPELDTSALEESNPRCSAMQDWSVGNDVSTQTDEAVSSEDAQPELTETSLPEEENPEDVRALFSDEEMGRRQNLIQETIGKRESVAQDPINFRKEEPKRMITDEERIDFRQRAADAKAKNVARSKKGPRAKLGALKR